jgi:hypothetical protein
MKRVAGALLLAVSCGGTIAPHEGVSSPTADGGESCANAFGACCPIGAIDWTMQTTTSTVRVCDFYDPQQKGAVGIIGGVPIKLIYLTIVAPWSGPSMAEADFIAGSNFSGTNSAGVSLAAEFAPRGVIFMELLEDGTLAELKAWVADPPNLFVGTDPNQSLGVFYDATAIPMNICIDARTLKTLSTDVGFDATNMAASIEHQLANLPQN